MTYFSRALAATNMTLVCDVSRGLARETAGIITAGLSETLRNRSRFPPKFRFETKNRKEEEDVRMESSKHDSRPSLFVSSQLSTFGRGVPRMGRPARITIALLAFLLVPVDQLWAQMDQHMGMEHNMNMEQSVDADMSASNHRVMTDEVRMIRTGIKNMRAGASEGNIEVAKSGLRTITMNWAIVKHELQARNDTRSIDEFEATSRSVVASLKSENTREIIQSSRKLSAVFDDVVKSLRKTDVNSARLVTSVGGFVLAWIFLTLVIAEIVKRDKIRL